MTDRIPAEVFPPGEFLREELEARDWTQVEFADIIGRPTRLVNEIVTGKRSITPETAQEIAAALGTSPSFWLNLQTSYKLSKAPPVPEKIARTAKLRDRFPVREMMKRGWIEPSENRDVIEFRVLRYFNIDSIDSDVIFHTQLAEMTRTNYLQFNWPGCSVLNNSQLRWMFHPTLREDFAQPSTIWGIFLSSRKKLDMSHESWKAREYGSS